MNESYKNKYLKYKSKYLKLKNQLGGADLTQPVTLNYQDKDYECEHLSWLKNQEDVKDFNSLFSNKNYKIMLGTKNDNEIEINNENYDKDTHYANYYKCMNKEEFKKRVQNMNNPFMNENLYEKLKKSNPNEFSEDIVIEGVPDWFTLDAEEISKYQIYCGAGGNYGETKDNIILQSLLPKYKNYLFMLPNEDLMNPCIANKNGKYNVYIFKKDLDGIENNMLYHLRIATFYPITNKSVQIGKLNKKINDAEKRKITDEIKQYENWKKAASERNEQDVAKYHQLHIYTLKNLIN